jgi:hypothetical protein
MDPETSTSMKTLTLVAIKRGLLLYWSLWFTIVFAMSVFAGLQELGVIDKGWEIAPGRFALISSTTAIYGVPAGAHGVWMLGVIVWEGIAVGAFWRTFYKFHGLKNAGGRALAVAFLLALSLYATFLLADKFPVNHLYEATHLKIFVAQVASLLAIYLLPE